MAATQYETQLVQQYGTGMQDYINAQRGLNGKNNVMLGTKVNNQDMARIVAGFNALPKAAPVATAAAPVAAPASTVPTLNQVAAQTYNPSAGVASIADLAGQKFQFDPNQYLPGIQNTAASIYNPQQAQIEALSKLNQSQTEQSKITTKAEFAKELEARIERINARGAFFGGGAINQENDVLARQTGALNNLEFNSQAQQAGFLAQQAGLSAEQAQYIQEKLSGAEGSAYSKFIDERGFQAGLSERDQDNFNEERAWNQSLTQEQRRIFEDDRDFQENVRQFGLNYALDKKAASDKGKNKGGGTYSQFTAGGKVYTINNASGQITETGLANPKGGTSREA